MATKRIDEEQFGPKGSLAISIHAATSLGPSQGDPVGGPITGAAKALLLDQSFQQQRAVAVMLLPISGQLAGALRENLAG
jgi:hypothetical protein